MVELIILLIFNSLLCFGVWNACFYERKVTGLKSSNEDQCYDYSVEETKGVLWFVDKWAKGKWFYKPLCYCLPCMASFHSVYPYWTYMISTNCININAVLFYPVYVLALSGLNYLIDRE